MCTQLGTLPTSYLVLCDDADRLSDFILSRPGCAYYRPSTTKRASAENATAA
jgi:hypothetical protein